MTGPAYRIEPLSDDHDRSAFRCSATVLTRYFHERVMQDVRRRITACFLCLSAEEDIVGYYTLASSSVALTALPDALSKRLPRYPSIPAVRMGRLAIAEGFQGQGLGSALLADALRRASGAEIAAYALIVDAKDAEAARFYTHHGFIAMTDAALTLFLPLASVKGLR